MPIVVDPQLQAYIDPLTPDEYAALERSLLAEGCRDALVLWGDVLVDGHNRYGICQQHNLPFQTVQNTQFQSIEDVHLWMIDQHLGRRSISDFQRGELALRKRAILSERRARVQAPPAADAASAVPAQPLADTPQPTAAKALESREDIAKAARLSSSQVVLIEKIRKQAAPELVAAVKSGTISINAAAAVASLPEDEQKAAVLAGKDELKLAAKRVRERRRRPQEGAASEHEQPEVPPVGDGELQVLRVRVALLEAENGELRQQLERWRNSVATVRAAA